MDLVLWVATAGAGDLTRSVPAGPMPAVGARARDQLDVRGDTAGAGDPVRGIPAVPVPVAGARAAYELSAQGGHCRAADRLDV